MTEPAPPPEHVRAAFGVTGTPVLLEGGQRPTWQVGELVLKPDVDAALQRWLGTVLADVTGTGFTLARARAAVDRRWVVDGWGATEFAAETRPADRTGDWAAVLAAGRAFHDASARVPRPRFLDSRTDAWAVADRAAWGEADLDVLPAFRGVVRRLRAGLAEKPAHPQLVHGDLTGNVLLPRVGEPVVIDVSPYWRPAEHAEAVVVVDAMTWFGAGPDLADRLGVRPRALPRALLFRVLTSAQRLASTADDVVLELEVERYVAAVDALGL